MAYCSSCGNEIKEGSRFCDSCGNEVQRSETEKHRVKIMNCPQCGATINTFLSKCESCGTVFRGLDASQSVKEFAQKLSETDSDKQRLNLIKEFPIPNTKEDIIEYMILASSNIGYKDDLYKDEEAEVYEEAWMTKFLQGYQKAKLVFAKDRDFLKIQKMYENTLARRENADNERKIRVFQGLLMKNLGVACGTTVLVFALLMDILNQNSSMLELIGVIVLIVSASNLKKRKADNIEYALVAGSGFVSIALSLLFDNGSMLLFGGVITIVISVISFIKCKK
ncbi:MAG: zinc ribbon domain-containing protein [Agathobacter sp.]